MAQEVATRTHPAVRVAVGDRVAGIDADLARLVEATWLLGISTEFSCQGAIGRHPQRAEPWGYILFTDVEDLRAFLVCFDGTELGERRFATRHETDPVTGVRQPVHRRGWSSTLSVRPPEPGEIEGGGQFRMPGRLAFPTADIARMTTILENRLRAASVGGQTGAP